MNSNRTIGEQASDALLEAGEFKAKAHGLRKWAERVADVCFIKATGKNAAERKANAGNMDEFMEADGNATKAECAAITAKARADAAMVMFEEWRTTEASRRQDGKVIASMAR